MKPSRFHPICLTVSLLVLGLLPVAPEVSAGNFPGNARVEVTDSTGALTVSNNQFTVSCWFKISVSSTQTVSQNMTILANQKAGTDTTTAYAYFLRYNIANNRIEFVTRGTSAVTNTLINSPYVERWYQIAVKRDSDQYKGFVDGRNVFTTSASIGNTAGSGLSIGGWAGNQPFFGDIQEVAIYQAALSDSVILDRMYQDQRSFAELKGYFKLGYSTNTADRYKNFVPIPPSGTQDGVPFGTIVFEETDEGGEQSAFDSRKNGGDDAIAPLSGAFSWHRTLFSRPTPGVAFDLSIAYGSSLPSPGGVIGTLDPYADPQLGIGWRHTFEARVLPDPNAPFSEYRVVGWEGSIETWVKSNGVFRTRHKEYRGELSEDGSYGFEWVTPERVKYRFRPLADGATMGGRLYEISDFNSNKVQIVWNESVGLISNIVDSVGGIYSFNYLGTRLTNVNFQNWNVYFQYDGQNRLTNTFYTGPSYYTNVNTRWFFTYDSSSGLLNRIVDPRGFTNTTVFYDKYGRVTNTLDALSRSNRTEFNVPALRSITRTDPAGQKWTEQYDRKGRLLVSTDPLNNPTTFTYDDAGNRTSITEPLGWATLFGYDNRANMLARTNALLEVTRWQYHPFFNKATNEVDAAGWASRFEYTPGGNLLRHYDDLATLVSYTYTTNGLVESSTDGNGRVSTYGYDTNGFRTRMTDAATNSWFYLPSEVGWVLAATNPLNQVLFSAYDINGHVVQRVDPLLRTFTSIFDPNGNLLAQSDAKNQFTTFVYDPANQRTQTVDRVSATNRVFYTVRGEVERVTDALNNSVTNVYDNANRLFRVHDPVGKFTENRYDANGNITNTVDKLGRSWLRQYDRLNRVEAESNPLNDTKRTTFDSVGRVKTVTTPKGFPTVNEYDGRGRLKQWTDAENYVWVYDYDGAGNITNITDALNGHYVMEYGPRNERTLERNQDNKEWGYHYDALLRPDQQTDPNGTVRTVFYDDGGRIDYVSFSTGRVDDHQYDENNNLTWLSRSRPGEPPTGSQFDYDAMDRIRESTDTFGKKVGYTHDILGRLFTLRYPDGKYLTNRYDTLSRLTNQVDWAGRQLNYQYDDAGRIKYRSYPNGVVQTNGFDEAGQITNLTYSVTNPQPSAINIALSYAYDRNGNKQSSEELGTFDWPIPAKRSEKATYTPSGRLIDRDISISNQLSTINYSYDPNGNMTNAVGDGQSWTLGYDEDNRTTRILWDAGITSKNITNRYDALGRRISRKMDGVESRYVLSLQGDMERILCDTSSAGQITAYYIHGPELSYKVTPGPSESITCYHADAQANIIALTGSGGTNLAQYAYTPYGRSLGSQLSTNYPQLAANSYTFVGSQGVMEELPGLYFMRARYYSADAGVFLCTDPVKNIGPTWKPEAFVYVNGNPMRLTDPKGEFVPLVGALIGGAVGGAIDLGFQTLVEGKSLKEVNWVSVGGNAAKGALVGSGVGLVTAVIGSAAIGAATEAGSQVAYENKSLGDIGWGSVAKESAWSAGAAYLGGVQLGNSGLPYLGAVRGPAPAINRFFDMGSSHMRNSAMHGAIDAIESGYSSYQNVKNRTADAGNHATSSNKINSNKPSSPTDSQTCTINNGGKNQNSSANNSFNQNTQSKAPPPKNPQPPPTTGNKQNFVQKSWSAVKNFFGGGKKK